MSNVFRNIPSVNELLENPTLRDLVDKANRNVVVTGVRTFLDDMRKEIQDAAADVHVPTPTELAAKIADWIVTEERPKLRPVINATGVLLHTGLGRAPLSDAAAQAVSELSQGYSSLEVSLETGERSQRVLAVERLLTQVTGAEAAVIVNNNAAATMLTMAAIAEGKEVIVSRGHLVEIGGSFRLPDVMEQSGSKLCEVGTTNKTRISDFQNAIGQNTGAMMRVHTSNFAIVGFTEQPSLEELVKLGNKRGVPVIDDVGSGALVDLAQYGVTDEPLVQDSIKQGADLVLFSGDKLLGGPQCGIIVGKKALINRIAKHPLMRALRVDKMTLGALAATLRCYQDGTTPHNEIPLLKLLATSTENLRNRADRLAPQLAAVDCVASADVIEDTSFLGGGSVPGQHIPTFCVAITPKDIAVDSLSAELRSQEPAVFGRVKNDQLLIDLRTVFATQDSSIVTAFQAIAKSETTSEAEPEPGSESDTLAEASVSNADESSPSHDTA